MKIMGASSSFAFLCRGVGRDLRRRVDPIWPSARQQQVRWFVSWDVQRVLFGRLRDGIRRIFRGEWCHYRDRSRPGDGSRGFFRLGHFQRFARCGKYNLQVYWCLPVVNRCEARPSRFWVVVVCRGRANRKGHLECGSTVSEFGALKLATESGTWAGWLGL